MASTTKKMTIMTTVLFVILMSWTTTKAQDISGETCIQALIPCAPFLGFSNPPAVCCDPLKMAIQTQLPCLCAVINDPTLGTMFNMTQVLQLPLDCGIKDVGPSMCTQGSPSTGSASALAPSVSTSAGSPSTGSASAPAPSVSTSAKTQAPSVSTSGTSSKTPPSPPLGNGSSRSIALAGPISSLMLLLTVFPLY